MRVKLVGLVALIALPLVSVSALIAWRQYEIHRGALGQALLGASRALSAAADRELAVGTALVEALATSSALDDGRLGDFHRQAATVAEARDAWILLIEPSGHIAVHTRWPIGTSLPNTFELEQSEAAEDELPRSGARWVRRIFETGAPVYSDLFHGPISGSFVVAAAVPVLRAGEVRYCLTIVMPARGFEPLVAGQLNVAGAGAVLFDSRGRIIARAAQSEEFVGQQVPPDVLQAVRGSEASVGYGRSVQNVPFIRAVTRSQVSGWSAGVSLTDETAFGPIWSSMRESAAIVAIILMFGMAAALWIGRSVARQQELKEEARAKDEFLAALGHELRNPVSAIALSAEALKRLMPPNPAVGDMIDRVSRQVGHLRRLIDDLLDTTRAAHGKLTLIPRAVDMHECASRLVQDYLRRPGMQVGIELVGAPVWVRADPARLHQMIDNLLDNAIKYGARHIRIDVSARTSFGVLSVEDDGEGIAPELLPRLFVPFVQGEQSTERARGGLGLGLALVKRLAEAQGGAIEARSAGRGRGATFLMRLPLVASPVEAAPSAAQPTSSTPSVSRRRVLVIDDLEDSRESLRRLLEIEGHEVATAADGFQGLAVLRSFRPDVALIDIGLPGMDGYALARAARAAIAAPMLLVALTGYGRESDRCAALEAGFDRHLVKPVAFDDLRAAIAAAPARERSFD